MNNASLYPMCKQHKHVHTCITQWEIFQQSIWQLLTNLETKHGVENFYHCLKEVQKSFSTHTKLRTAIYNGHELILLKNFLILKHPQVNRCLLRNPFIQFYCVSKMPNKEVVRIEHQKCTTKISTASNMT